MEHLPVLLANISDVLLFAKDLAVEETGDDESDENEEDKQDEDLLFLILEAGWKGDANLEVSRPIRVAILCKVLSCDIIGQDLHNKLRNQTTKLTV